MKQGQMGIAIMMLFLASLVPMPTIAASKTITQAQSEGFRACRSLGRTGYSAVVRGTQSGSTPQRGGTWPFTIRYCFPSKSECDRFVSGIRNIVAGIDKVRSASCKPRT